MAILLLAIILLEIAYKKDNGRIAILGIETIVIAIITLALIYIHLMFASRYVLITLATAYILALYYVIKSVVIYIRGKQKYFLDDVKEMINTDE